MMSIDKQKEVAKKIYSKLKIVDPHCILAGGAPRDWYFGNEAQDLDFYFASTVRTIGAVRKQLEASFPESEITLLMDKEQGSTNEMYKSMSFLIRIWELVVDNISVQLIQVEIGKQWKVVDNMDISICQCWYINDEIKTHQNFRLTEKSGVMFTVKEGYTWQDRHAAKIKERFTKYRVGSKQLAIDTILKMTLDY